MKIRLNCARAAAAISCVCACTSPRAVESRVAPAREPPTSAYVAALQQHVGPSARLTLDPGLQSAAERAVRATGRAAALVAMDPTSGSVRALFSVPGERGDPLLAAHQPASTFKTFTALAGLEAGVLTADTQKQCSGRYAFHGQEFRCAGVHGSENTQQAIVRSCNSFFFDVATQLEHERVLDMARRVGFGERTGIELPDAAGVVPSNPASQEPTGAALLDAIGHGKVELTLLQLARAYAALANGGALVPLSVTGAHQSGRSLHFVPEHLELAHGALVSTVADEDGTAHALATLGLPVAAKTGSSQAPPLRAGAPEEDDTWLVAYTPPSSPKILVAVRVERSSASANAKTVGTALLEAWHVSSTER